MWHDGWANQKWKRRMFKYGWTVRRKASSDDAHVDDNKTDLEAPSKFIENNRLWPTQSLLTIDNQQQSTVDGVAKIIRNSVATYDSSEK